MTAWSAALNGNTNAIASRIDLSVPDTASPGTSATNAIGSDSRNAISDATLTSRARPPMATPERPEREPPEPERRHPQLEPGPVEVHEQRHERRHQQRDHRGGGSGQRDLLRQQPARRHQPADQPRVGVLGALEREQPGGEQHATNISDTITAIAAAYVSVGVVLPASSVVWTVSGDADRAQHRARERRGPRSPGWRSSTTCWSAGRSGESGGSEAIAPWTIVRRVLQPEQREVLAEEIERCRRSAPAGGP